MRVRVGEGAKWFLNRAIERFNENERRAQAENERRQDVDGLTVTWWSAPFRSFGFELRVLVSPARGDAKVDDLARAVAERTASVALRGDDLVVTAGDRSVVRTLGPLGAGSASARPDLAIGIESESGQAVWARLPLEIRDPRPDWERLRDR